jgi:2-phosphosulfolactate phosphatase
MATTAKPALYTCLSPALLNLYDINQSIVVVIDVLRATSTMATALHNGARQIIPVDSVDECIRIGKQLDAITAGERDGKIAEGLQYGNSPFEYPESFIKDKTLVLTTTNGTKLIHMALNGGAKKVITGSFGNLSAVCDFLLEEKKPVLLGCSAWKDRVNYEDTLFAGAVIDRIKDHFQMHCDASKIAHSIFQEAKPSLFDFMKQKEATHYHRLSSYGLEADIRYCLEIDTSPVLPLYKDGKLIRG